MNVIAKPNHDLVKLTRQPRATGGLVRALVEPVKQVSIEDSRKLDSRSKSRDAKQRVEALVEDLAY